MKNKKFKYITGFAIWIISLYIIIYSFSINDNKLLYTAGLCNMMCALFIYEISSHSITFELKKMWEGQSNDWKKSCLECQDILLKERNQSDD